MILDATCGLKQIWLNKNPKDTIYLDLREGKIEYPSKYRNHSVEPTIVADNRMLPLKDESFDMVIYDPPYILANKATGVLTTKYGILNPFTWRNDIYRTTRELIRVLKQGGFMIFKWGENNKTIKEALKLFPIKPLFGTNTSNYRVKTWFIVFRKEGE